MGTHNGDYFGMSLSDRGDRGALVALGLALLVVALVWFFGWACDTSNEAVNQTASSDGAGRDIRTEAGEALYWCVFTTRDTLAQWIAALSSIASAVISIWAVSAVRATLAETKATTQATRDGNIVAQKVGEAQVRAYLATVGAGISGDETTEHPTITFRLKNTGNSPAKAVRIGFKCAYTTNSSVLQPQDDFAPSSGPKDGFGRHISPQEEVEINTTLTNFPMKTETMERAQRDSILHLDAIVKIEFEDVFDITICDEQFWTALVNVEQGAFRITNLHQVPFHNFSLSLLMKSQAAAKASDAASNT